VLELIEGEELFKYIRKNNFIAE